MDSKIESIEPQKRIYTMSEAKLVHLAKARQRALELRKELHAINPPRAETLKKPRKPSKLEMKIAEAKRLNEESPTIEPVAEPVPVTEPEPTPVSPSVAHRAPEVPPLEPKQKVIIKKLKIPKEPPIKRRKEALVAITPTTIPPSSPPVGFRRNDFGFYVL